MAQHPWNEEKWKMKKIAIILKSTSLYKHFHSKCPHFATFNQSPKEYDEMHKKKEQQFPTIHIDCLDLCCISSITHIYMWEFNERK